MNNDIQETWERYVSSWKAASATEKRALFEDSLEPDCVYTDPITKTRDWESLLQYMKEFHEQIPGGHFVTTRFFTHDNKSVACWNMVAGDGSVVGDGLSYGEYGEGGRLTSMTGFFEPPQP